MDVIVLVVIISSWVFDFTNGFQDTAPRYVTPRPALAVLCFLACALVVGYDLYLIIVR